MEMLTPSSRRRCSVASVISVLCISTDSVISISSRLAGNRAEASALTMTGHQILVHDLNRRKVDRDLDVVRPMRGVDAGLADDPFADRGTISPISSATGMNSAGEIMPRSGCFQRSRASQRSHPVVLQAARPADSAARTRPSAKRLTQRQFERAARLHAGVHLRLEEAIGAATVRFRPVQGHVGVLAGDRSARCRRPARWRCRCWHRQSQVAVEIVGRSDRLADASRQRRGRRSAFSTPAWTMTNSSPPTRATVSVSRTLARSRSATAFSNSSPT